MKKTNRSHSLKRLTDSKIESLLTSVEDELKRRKAIAKELRENQEVKLLAQYQNDNVEKIILEVIREHTKYKKTHTFIENVPDLVTSDYVGILEMEFWKLFPEDIKNSTVKHDYYKKVLKQLIKDNKVYAYYTSIYKELNIRGQVVYKKVYVNGPRALALTNTGDIPSFNTHINSFIYKSAVYDEKHNFWISYKDRKIYRKIPDDALTETVLDTEEDFSKRETYDYDSS